MCTRMEPTRNDADKLRDALSNALAALPEVRHTNGYPIYPAAFREFTHYISLSPRHRSDYTVDMQEDLRANIEALPLGKVKSFLTMMIRLDRFSPGGLLGLIEDGTAERVVARAVALAET